MRLIVLLAIFTAACSGSPTGPTSPVPHAAVRADVHWECSEQDGWYVCVDTDPPEPPSPPPVDPGADCTQYPYCTEYP